MNAELRQLFDDEFDAMVGLARVLCRNSADVEDVVMDAFVATAERWTVVDRPGAYLRRAVVNGARRRGRTHDRRRRIRERNVVSLLPSPAPDPGEHHIADVLARLSEREHTAVALVHHAGFTYAEAAELMDEPVGTIKALVSRTMARLRQELSA